VFFQTYTSYLFTKFINHFIISGKKQKIDHVFNNVLIYLKLKYHILPIIIFYEIIEKLKSPFSLISHRRGPRVYQLPIFLTPLKQYKIAIYWFILCIKKSNKYRYRKNKNNSRDFILNNQLIKNFSLENTFIYSFNELYTLLFTVSYADLNNFALINSRYFKRRLSLYNSIGETRLFLHFRWTFD
jgi:ribosomal protein S7